MSDQKVLMVLIEPTPYLLDLIQQIKSQTTRKIEVLFLASNFTQNWHLLPEENYTILPRSKKSIIKYLFQYTLTKKYQLIFLAGWSHPVSLIIMILAKLRKIPVAVDSDTPLPPNIPFLKKAIKRILYPILFKLPNIFLPGGTRQAKYLQYYGVPNHKIIIEKMTVDIKAIQLYIAQLDTDSRIIKRKKLGIHSDDLVFLFIGRLIERKGILELLEVFSEISHQKVKLLVIGDGPLRTAVAVFAKNNHNTLFAGWLEKEKIIDMYFISDVFILPAHWEPWGLVINEAMAAGKPVITTDQVGCVDDLVIPHKTGLVIKSNCIDDLIAAIHYFINNPEKCVKMSQHALEHISNWTLEDSAKQVLHAWDKISKII